MLEIRWHGRAGQGAKTTSHILALALVEAGQWVQAFPEYGPERSGSPMRAYNRSDDRPIRRRDAVTSPNAVVVLDPSLLTEVDAAAGLAPDGLLVLNTEEPESVVRQQLQFDGGRLVCVAGDAMAAAAATRHPNVVLLGALAGALGQPPLDALHAAVESTLGGKLAPAALHGTITALDAGFAVGTRVASANPGRGVAPEARAVTPPQRYDELPQGAVVLASAERLRTAGWRGGTKPRVDLSRCVNCLLCWVYCPDVAVTTEGDRLVGFDFALCKGCELCVEVCPVEAIAMVAETETLPPYGAIAGVSGMER